MEKPAPHIFAADNETFLTTTEWSRFYVRPGNTVSVSHASATLALFSYGNAVFLCTPVPE